MKNININNLMVKIFFIPFIFIFHVLSYSAENCLDEKCDFQVQTDEDLQQLTYCYIESMPCLNEKLKSKTIQDDSAKNVFSYYEEKVKNFIKSEKLSKYNTNTSEDPKSIYDYGGTIEFNTNHIKKILNNKLDNRQLIDLNNLLTDTLLKYAQYIFELSAEMRYRNALVSAKLHNVICINKKLQLVFRADNITSYFNPFIESTLCLEQKLSTGSIDEKDASATLQTYEYILGDFLGPLIFGVNSGNFDIDRAIELDKYLEGFILNIDSQLKSKLTNEKVKSYHEHFITFYKEKVTELKNAIAIKNNHPQPQVTPQHSPGILFKKTEVVTEPHLQRKIENPPKRSIEFRDTILYSFTVICLILLIIKK